MVAVIAAIVVVIVVSSGGGKSHTSTTGSSTTSRPTASTTPPTTAPPTTTATTATTTTTPSSLTPAETKLAKYLPIDLDPPTDCVTNTGVPTGVTNLAATLSCNGPAATGSDPGLPGGTIFAYQFTSATTFQQGLAAYNTFKNFDPTTATHTCPPTTATSDGVETWNNPSNTLSGTVECLDVQDTGSTVTMPSYIWTIPAQNIIMTATGAKNTTFAALNTWFLSFNSPR